MSRDRVAIRPRTATPDGTGAILERARQRGFHRFVLSTTQSGQPHDPDDIVIQERAGSLDPGGSAIPIPITRVDTEGELTGALQSAPSGGVLASNGPRTV